MYGALLVSCTQTLTRRVWNWKVVRDVDVFKILVRLASSVVQYNGIKKQNKQNSPILIQQMLLMIEI